MSDWRSGALTELVQIMQAVLQHREGAVGRKGKKKAAGTDLLDTALQRTRGAGVRSANARRRSTRS